MRRLLPTSLILAALLLVGCGTSGGEATETSSSNSTSVPADGPTSQDLEAILPTAEDLGPEWEITDTDGADDDADDDAPDDEAPDDEPDPSEAAFEQACPELMALGVMDDEDNADEVSVTFEAEDDREVEVALDPTPQVIDEDEFDQIIDAYNACTEVSFDDEDGSPVTMQLSAERLEGYGDLGVDLTLSTDVLLFQIPVTVEMHGYIFLVDGIGVSVTTTNGLDMGTFETVPADDLLVPLADEMLSRVEAL